MHILRGMCEETTKIRVKIQYEAFFCSLRLALTDIREHMVVNRWFEKGYMTPGSCGHNEVNFECKHAKLGGNGGLLWSNIQNIPSSDKQKEGKSTRKQETQLFEFLKKSFCDVNIFEP